ncbi:protein rep, partial [Holophaga foetida]|uniref:protein rep n=1 Tax=Holophaga foetida TaxID=35839 RepID=UPI003137FE80
MHPFASLTPEGTMAPTTTQARELSNTHLGRLTPAREIRNWVYQLRQHRHDPSLYIKKKFHTIPPIVSEYLANLRDIDPSLADQIIGCMMGHYFKRSHCGRRLCPMCAVLNADKAANELAQALMLLTGTGKVSPSQVFFVTLTASSNYAPDLTERMDQMNQVRAEWIKTEQRRGRVLGSYWGWDIAGTEPYHAHMHGILILSPENATQPKVFQGIMHDYWQAAYGLDPVSGDPWVNWRASDRHWEKMFRPADLEPL